MSESDAKKEMAPVRRTADELSVVTRSQPQTVAVGRALGECLAEGDVLVLTGDLGRRSSPRAWPPALASRKT